MAANPQFAGTARTGVAQFTNADGTALKNVCTIGSNGAVIENIFITSTDTQNNYVYVYLQLSGTSYLLDAVYVPAATTTRPVVVVPVLDPSRWQWLDPVQPKMVVQANAVLRANVTTAVTSSKQLTVFALYGDF